MNGLMIMLTNGETSHGGLGLGLVNFKAKDFVSRPRPRPSTKKPRPRPKTLPSRPRPRPRPPIWVLEDPRGQGLVLEDTSLL